MTSQPRTPLTVEEIPGGTQSPTPHGGQRDSGISSFRNLSTFSEGSSEVIPGPVEPCGGVSRGEAQPSFLDPLISFDVISLGELNSCLDRWDHKMGALNRPTPTRAHGLRHNGRLVAVTATDHLMAAAVKGLARSEAVELSRVCAERPDLCRVAVRLWREFILPTTGKPWAISYQDAVIHGGNLYRFDGWVRLGFSHSGRDTRSGRPGRDKWVWAWNADPRLRTPQAASLKSREAA